jgi:transposase
VKNTTIAVDLAKSVFQVAVSDRPGRILEHHRLSRPRFLTFFAQRPPGPVLLEACGSAHHWARQLQALGHAPVLLPPHSVRRYRSGNKTDRADAKALLEAFRNQEIHPVPIKSLDQQALTALHRLRSALLATRTARINTVRGMLREFGVTIPQGASNVMSHVRPLLAEPPEQLPGSLRIALDDALNEIVSLESRIRAFDHQLLALAPSIPAVQRLRSVPGIGPLTATALVAFVGDPRRFSSGRHFASFLGLTPREWSSGAVRRLGSISKRGDGYLRMLLIHGARAVLWAAKSKKEPDRLRQWALGLEAKRGHNKAAVALANKLARIAWAVWSKETRYDVITTTN